MTPAQQLTAAHRGRWHGGYGAIRTPGHSGRDFGTIIHDRLDGKGVYIFCFNADWRDVRQALGLEREQRPLTPSERRKTAQLRKEVARQAAEEDQRRRTLALSIWKSGSKLEASNG